MTTDERLTALEIKVELLTRQQEEIMAALQKIAEHCGIKE